MAEMREGQAMKRVSLSDMAVNAPASASIEPKKAERPKHANKGESKQVNKQASDQGGRVQVAFRMDKDAYRDLKRMALDEDTSVNELILRALNELRERKGLKKLTL